MAGHLDFYKATTAAGIKPLLGIETYQTIGSRYENQGGLSRRDDHGEKVRLDNFHLILIAMNNTGLRNLWAMNSEAHCTGFYYNGRVDWDLLERYNEGILCTSACGLGALSQALRGNPNVPDEEQLITRYQEIFGDRFYIELSTYSEPWQRDMNYQLTQLAETFGIPMLYANDAHYAFPQQYELHETLLCMQYQEKKSQLTEPHHTPDLYIMSEKEINAAFYYLPQSIVDEVIDNTDEIASKCSVSMPEHKMHVPVFVPESKWATGRDMLFDLAVEGYEKKIAARGLEDEVYMPRFEMEMKVITQAGLTDYLLMVRDFIVWAKEEKGLLVGPGRGSIGGSLVAYLIGIHEIDPIRYGLIFERFYNIGRESSLPDIDVDFPTWSRDMIKEYLINKYGEEYCADIGTVSSFQGRSAVQKIGSALETPFPDTRAISKIIENAIQSGQQPKWEGEKGLWATSGPALTPFKAKHPKLFEYAETLYGRTNTYGVHASGFVIADVPLADHFPLRWNAKEKKPVTQWDMRVAEQLGYMKMDILGLRNLDTLMEYNKVLKEEGKEQVDFYDVLRMDEDGELPEEMWQILDEGRTVGVFQIEDASFVKSITKKIRPRSLEELALITALNRPGPMKANSPERYINARNGNPHTPAHPIFNDVAMESHGEIVYQEQFIAFFEALGYDKNEADSIRSIVGKKKRDAMAKIKPDFIERCRKLPWPAGDGNDAGALTQQLIDSIIEKMWEDFEGFADYAFNKAHSVEYGLISLWTLYAKYKNPAEFYLASIRSLVAEGMKGEVPRYIREARASGINILPVDMNHSKATTRIEDDGIRYGFQDIKGIGASVARWLVDHGPYRDLDEIIEIAEDPDNKIRLKNGVMTMAVNRGHVERLRRLTESEGEELYEAEEELLGYSLSDTSADILDQYSDEIAEECVALGEVDTLNSGRYTVAGIIADIKETKTKAGKPMAWVTIENNGEQQQFTVWDSELTRLSFIWRRRQAVMALVNVNAKGQNIMGAKILKPKEH